MKSSQRMRQIQTNSADKNTPGEDPDFAETVELSFRYGPRPLRPWSRFIKFLVNFFICVTQLGFCCIYFVFIFENFEQVWNFYVKGYEFDYYVKLLTILLPVLLVSMITNLKYLAPCSTIANICMATGIALTFYYGCQDLPDISERNYVGEVKNLPLFFGTAIFAFEGIALVRCLLVFIKNKFEFKFLEPKVY